MSPPNETQTAGRPAPPWSIRTVHDAALVGRGIRIEHSSLPAIEGLGLAELAEWHTGQASDERRALRVGADEVDLVGPEGTITRWFEYLDRGAPRRGLAAYARLGEELHWVVAEATPDVDDGVTAGDSVLLGVVDAWLAAQATVLLSALEVRVLGELLELPAVNFIGAAWYPELSSESRLAIGSEIIAGLLRRGVLRGDDVGQTGNVLSAAADPLVRAVLDGDQIVVLTRTGAAGVEVGGSGSDEPQRPGRETIVLARSADGVWILLRAEPDGMLRLSPVFRNIGEELERLTGAGGFAAHDHAQLSDQDRPTSIVELRRSLTDDSSRWRGSTGVQAVRRTVDGLQMAEYTWLLDDVGAAWAVEASLETGAVRLTAVDREAVSSALRSVLESAPRDGGANAHHEQGREDQP
ncbi:hypothetical protein [Agromyces sp. NPDC049794]|uniref:hypothetical protein n=1 Tax=unclassified Agromyces TaxID=2639701 RepID=UPI0033D509A0